MPRRGTSRLDSRARVHPRPPASAALAVSAVARLPREQAGTVSIASGAQARRAVRAGAANAERGRALGAGRVGARASAPWSGPGGREPTRPLGDLRAGQQPGAQDEHPASTRRLAASAAALAHELPVRAAAQRVCAHRRPCPTRGFLSPPSEESRLACELPRKLLLRGPRGTRSRLASNLPGCAHECGSAGAQRHSSEACEAGVSRCA